MAYQVQGARTSTDAIRSARPVYSNMSAEAGMWNGISGGVDKVFDAYKQKKKEERLKPYEDAKLASLNLSNQNQELQNKQLQEEINNQERIKTTISLGNFADQLVPSLEKGLDEGDISEAIRMAKFHKNELDTSNKNSVHTNEIVDNLMEGDIENLRENGLPLLKQLQYNRDLINQQQQAQQNANRPFQFGETIKSVDPETNEIVVSQVVRDPSSGTAKMTEIQRLPQGSLFGTRNLTEDQKLEAERQKLALKNEMAVEKEQKLESETQEGQFKIRSLAQKEKEAKKNATKAIAMKKDLITQIDKALKQDYSPVMGSLDTFFDTRTESSQNLINGVLRIKDSLTADNLKIMTGPKTNKDLDVISSVATSIRMVTDGEEGSYPRGIAGSPKALKEELFRLKSSLQGLTLDKENFMGQLEAEEQQKLIQSKQINEDDLQFLKDNGIELN